MNGAIVRIEQVEIRNFKNVVHGIIGFKNTHKSYKASVLGLYGQNGSGKTALIDVIDILKYVLSGRSVPTSYGACIHVDADYAQIQYKLTMENAKEQVKYDVVYQFKLRKESLSPDEITEMQPKDTFRVVVFDEVLSTAYQDAAQSQRLQKIIDTNAKETAFLPKVKYDIFTGGNKAVATDLLVAKRMAEQTGRSFIFSKECRKIFHENCKEKHLTFLIDRLSEYGKSELFVIDTKNTAMISLSNLPLALKYHDDQIGAFGEVPIPLWDAGTIPSQVLELLQKVIANMNIVLEQLVPGLTIGVVNLGEQLLESGAKANRIQLVSLKNKKAIPLRFESEGIKKIISVLQLLIVVYNQPSITVAIDELDAGIFEYLLGELLRIISEKGKGQLIFTSHNLRPLETIDRGFVAFTTVNPENRYIRMTNVKNSNNLRDFYYRDITLGEQSETVYDPTNNYEIALAFREASAIFVP